MSSHNSMEDLNSVCRTILVENISHEVSEEALLERFKQVGNVINFKLIRDEDLLRNKTVAYCEYSHTAMALNAFRIMNGADFFGQRLRINLMTQNQDMNTSNERIAEENNESGEAISQAVASLPPNQMYELMKQMKLCIQNNPNEARNMLLQNPQLAYALLQAQIVMKIADPKVAIVMLNRTSDQIPQMVLDTLPIKSSTGIQLHGRNVSMFPETAPLHNPSAPCSSFDKVTPEMDSKISSLSRFFLSNNINLQPTMSENSLTTGKNINMNPLKNESFNIPLEEQNGKERAALILQVLKLTDQQISLLPEDQRRSILVLKEQLRKN